MQRFTGTLTSARGGGHTVPIPAETAEAVGLRHGVRVRGTINGVAYRSSLLHVVVLHRIIREAGNRYVFKGDNNNFIDPTRPVRSELIGSLWLHLPHAGAVLRVLHTPVVAAAVIGIVALLTLGGVSEARRRRRRRRGSKPSAGPAPRRLTRTSSRKGPAPREPKSVVMGRQLHRTLVLNQAGVRWIQGELALFDFSERPMR